MTSDELQTIVRGNIKSRRRELRLTQVEVAEAMGMTQAFVSQIEKGIKGTSLETIAKFAEVLHTTPDTLLRAEAFSIAVA